MSKRTKPTPEIVANLPQAEGALAEMAAIDRKLAGIEAEMNAKIDAAKTQAQRDGAGLQFRRKVLEQSLVTFATLNKVSLFVERQSVDLAFGIIHRRQSARIIQQSRVSPEMTIEKLHEFGLVDFIRLTPEVNKAAMTDWPDERLETVGLKRQYVDKIDIEIKAEEIKDAA